MGIYQNKAAHDKGMIIVLILKMNQALLIILVGLFCWPWIGMDGSISDLIGIGAVERGEIFQTQYLADT